MNGNIIFKNFNINSFDFKNESLINEAIDLLNSNTINNRHTRIFWDWRYNQNPFGESIGWYARDMETDKLAGVLLWWPWVFNLNKENFKLYQAINGKTAKEYRNSGIFLELNKIAINYFKEKKIALYGVPNSQSYPSYEKLGWTTISRVNPIAVLISPLRTFIKILFFKKNEVVLNTINQKIDTISRFILDNNAFCTNWDEKALEWRFINHPVFKYFIYSKNHNVIIFKLKKRAIFNEAQIIFTSIDNTLSIKHFIKFLSKNNIDFYTYYGLNTIFSKKTIALLLKKRIKKLLYIVVNNLFFESGYMFRFELAETDTQ